MYMRVLICQGSTLHSILLTICIRQGLVLNNTRTHRESQAPASDPAPFIFSLMLIQAGSQVGVSIQASKKEINSSTHNLGRTDEHILVFICKGMRTPSVKTNRVNFSKKEHKIYCF